MMIASRTLYILVCCFLLNVMDARRNHHRSRTQKLRQNRPLSTPYSSIYGEWSSWGRCNQKCRQFRTRDCYLPAYCNPKSLRKSRSCSPNNCAHKFMVIPIREHSDSYRSGRFRIEAKMLKNLQNAVFSEWSDWAPCNGRCSTSRLRRCLMPEACAGNILQQNAICYEKNSACERDWKKKIGKSKKYNDSIDGREALHELDNQECGISMISKDSMLRIIGGREALQGSWPWQIALLNKHKQFYCGGSLISPKWVITAAHCVRRLMYIRAGEYNLNDHDGTEQDIRVEEYFIHEEFDPVIVDKDIALLKLEKRLVITDYVKPVCLPDSDDMLRNRNRGTILGWGKRRDNSDYGADILRQAEVPIVNLDDCRDEYQEYEITDDMICAGYKRGRVDACTGDSGGSLLLKNENKWYLYGVTSFGEGCGEEGKYGIYANVPNFVDWIRWIVAHFS